MDCHFLLWKLFKIIFLFENKEQNWILIQYMREHYIWCSSGIDLRTPIVQRIFMWLIFGTWKLLLRKICRWQHSLYRCKQYSRSPRKTNKYHTEALYLIWQQSNEYKQWKISTFAEHTRGWKHPNIKYNNKLFKITKTIRYSVWQQNEVWRAHWEYFSKSK